MPDPVFPPQFWTDLEALKGHLEAASAALRTVESEALSGKRKAANVALLDLHGSLAYAKALIERNAPTY